MGGGEESWGRNRGGAAWLWKIKNVRCSFPFFFFFRAIYPFIVEDYRGRIKETRTDGKFLYACVSCKIFENRILDGLFVDGLDDDDYL